ncbi:MAG: hypothetical protein GX028_09325 [Clostridiaceae bacterium]|nr:hypothetical protein [Clostridiaceae bacterium]
MKSIKILLAMMLTIALTIGLMAGCSDKSEETTAPGTTESSPTETTGADTDGEDANAIGFDYSESLDEKGFWKDVTALDHVTLFDYKKIEIGEDVHAISDDELKQQIDSLVNSYAEDVKVEDRAVVDGDTVNIDYVGSVDGVEFQGGNTQGNGADVTIGKTTYIDDFLQQLIGHKPGETFDVEVTFPADYGVEELNGKDAVFVTTINHILETKVPELNDEFVTSNFAESESWKTVADLNEGIRSEMQKSAISVYLQDYVIDASTVSSVPESLIEFQEKSMLDYYQGYAASYGVELDEFAKTYLQVENTEALLAANREQNEEMAKFYLIIQAIAEDAELALSDDDVKEYFIKQYSEDDYSALVENAGMPYMKMIVINQRVLEELQENVVLA